MSFSFVFWLAQFYLINFGLQKFYSGALVEILAHNVVLHCSNARRIWIVSFVFCERSAGLNLMIHCQTWSSFYTSRQWVASLWWSEHILNGTKVCHCYFALVLSGLDLYLLMSPPLDLSCDIKAIKNVSEFKAVKIFLTSVVCLNSFSTETLIAKTFFSTSPICWVAAKNWRVLNGHFQI